MLVLHTKSEKKMFAKSSGIKEINHSPALIAKLIFKRHYCKKATIKRLFSSSIEKREGSFSCVWFHQYFLIQLSQHGAPLWSIIL